MGARFRLGPDRLARVRRARRAQRVVAVRDVGNVESLPLERPQQGLRDREVDSKISVTDAEVDNYLATVAAQTGIGWASLGRASKKRRKFSCSRVWRRNATTIASSASVRVVE